MTQGKIGERPYAKKITNEKKQAWTGRAKQTLAVEACKYRIKQARGENEVFLAFKLYSIKKQNPNTLKKRGNTKGHADHQH